MLQGFYRNLAILLSTVCILSACATGLRETSVPSSRRSSRTVVLFLVDGMGVKTLQSSFATRRASNIRRHFLRDGNSFALGQAAFPTQTYPNISSILTALPVDQQPIIANHVLLPNGKVANFESQKYHDKLRAQIDPISMIGRLNAEGRETASFSYVFGMNAGSHMSVGITEGIEYKRHDYEDLDGRLLSELENYLSSRGDSSNWPDFIYVHLVGVDGMAHRYGALSRDTLDYVSWLDARMGSVLSVLRKGEKRGRQVVSVLTADHGFVDTKRFVSLRRLMSRVDLDLVVTNESRFLGLHLPPKRDPREMEKALTVARKTSGVEFTVWRNGSELEIADKKSRFRFLLGPAVCEFPVSMALVPEGNIIPAANSFRCPTEFDDLRGKYPLLVSQMSRYFSAPNHPDAIVVAEPDVSFAQGAAANHGGPTADETFVPVLLRNASLLGQGPTPTSDLLKVLMQDQAFLPIIENMKKKPMERHARAK